MSQSQVSPSVAPSESGAPTAAASTQQLQVDAAAQLGQFYDDVHGYIEGEMAVQQEEWDFIARANEALTSKYNEVGLRVENATGSIRSNNEQLEKLPEVYAQIDELEKQIAALEGTMKSVDAYTGALEKQFMEKH